MGKGVSLTEQFHSFSLKCQYELTLFMHKMFSLYNYF